jgi:hypothetical protein
MYKRWSKAEVKGMSTVLTNETDNGGKWENVGQETKAQMG